MSGVTGFIRRHPVATFYALTFAISWGAIFVVLGSSSLFGTAATIGVAGTLSLAGPSVAGVLLTGLVDGQAGLARLVAGLRRWRVAPRWYAAALLIGPLVMAGTLLGLSLASAAFLPAIVTDDDRLRLVVSAIAAGFVVALCEELGWTGFALPRLRQQKGLFATGLLMGVLWSIWHFPFFAGTTDPAGAVPAALLVGVLLFSWLPPYRILMVWLHERTGSLLLVTLMHVAIVVCQFVLATGRLSATEHMTVVLMWGAAFWVIVALVWANGYLIRRHAVAIAQQNLLV